MHPRGSATRAWARLGWWAWLSLSLSLSLSLLSLSLLASAGGAACARASAGPARAVEQDAGIATPAVTPPLARAPAAKAALIARLARLNQSRQFLFGQENATLWGMYLDGGLVSTKTWFSATALAGRFTSDSEAVVGDAPAVLGVSLGMLAFEPTTWNRRAVVAAAIRRQLAAGGVVTIDWHAPSCDARVNPGSVTRLSTVVVDGHDVAIDAVEGGALFYAEEQYTHAITSRADVPEALKCLCHIANDLPLTDGPYRGMTGKTWLIARARHAAQVLRDEGLSDAPLIVRPFHEHNGSWFWWGQPYWNCAALLNKPDAVSGAAAYKEVARSYVTALRGEPGMGNLLFAYSTDRLLGPAEGERFTDAENKVTDPSGFARDRLRQRMVRELGAAGLAYVSPAQQAATLRLPLPAPGPAMAPAVTPVITPAGARRAAAYVAQRRPYYAEAYAGDDVFDLLGIDLYYPMARAATRADLWRFRLQLRVLAEEARARGKPYALTETGTYRLQLAQLTSRAARAQTLVINGKASVEDALARLFDPADRAALLRHFGLSAPGPIALDAAQRAAVMPRASEDWFNQQLLVLAKESQVAYALVWQTYYDSAQTDRYFNYYVPYPGHPDAPSYQRFHDDPATCFLRDGCGR